MSVMTGPMQRMYGAATMVGKDEMNGRINPAMEPDEDLPIIETQRKKSMQRAAKNPFRPEASDAEVSSAGIPQPQGNTAF